jgi:hypothetical protein
MTFWWSLCTLLISGKRVWIRTVTPVIITHNSIAEIEQNHPELLESKPRKTQEMRFRCKAELAVIIYERECRRQSWVDR